MKKIKKIIILSGISLFLTGCGDEKILQNQELSKEIDEVKIKKEEIIDENYNQKQIKEDEILNWKLYENNDHNISFKYPDNFKIKGTKNSEDVLRTQIVDDWVGLIIFDAVIYKSEEVDASNMKSGLGLSVSKMERPENLFRNQVAPEDLLSNEDLIIDGKKAIKYIYKSSAVDESGNLTENVQVKSYKIDGGEYAYEFFSFGSDREYFEKIDQIIETIKFK